MVSRGAKPARFRCGKLPPPLWGRVGEGYHELRRLRLTPLAQGGGNATPKPQPRLGRPDSYNGSSGSRLALRLAAVAEGDDAERTKLQRTLGACRESCRITICAVRRGPSLPARNTLSSSSTLSSSASKVQTSRFGSTSIAPRASLSRLAFTEGCR